MELYSVLWGSLDGSGVWGRMDSCICLVEFLHCSYETTTTLFTGYESETESHLVMFDSLGTHRRYSPWNSPGQNIGVGSFSLLQGNLPNSGIEPRPPTLQADSLPAQPQGKPKNTGVGSLSLLHGIVLTQESNRGLDSLPTELYTPTQNKKFKIWRKKTNMWQSE